MTTGKYIILDIPGILGRIRHSIAIAIGGLQKGLSIIVIREERIGSRGRLIGRRCCGGGDDQILFFLHPTLSFPKIGNNETGSRGGGIIRELIHGSITSISSRATIRMEYWFGGKSSSCLDGRHVLLANHHS
jgi:hypothetical protein